MEAYLRALELWFSRLEQRKIGSIFFGGGTPSLLDPKLVELLLQKINKLWGINNNDCEISIEAKGLRKLV
jgi:coproporphyrinogen III oxidase-like Fe-S oxidoreductase